MADRVFETVFADSTLAAAIDLDKVSMAIPDTNGKAVLSLNGISNISVEATYADFLVAWKAFANTP